jgi:hypothetical protein
MTHDRNLVVLGCSATKTNPAGVVPAISLYDGPTFRVLRSFLRDYRWPTDLSIAVLSAKYGLIGAVTQISTYNKRMTERRAAQLNPEVTAALVGLGEHHQRIDLVMGRDYLNSIDMPEVEEAHDARIRVAKGPIGMKLNHLHRLLRSGALEKRLHAPELTVSNGRPLYFLPDWDDFVDADFDFVKDKFSEAKRDDRSETHVSMLTAPRKMSDGVLVSLAQHLGRKGLLKRVHTIENDSLAPRSVRRHFGLSKNQWAFGDCGAFSYCGAEDPSITVEQAVNVYDLYEFDLGASVDHIPLEEVFRDGKTVRLTSSERRRRVDLTRRNAQRFIDVHEEVGARFIPVGVVQGVTAADYAKQIPDYIEMGYSHLALGGLVPRNDGDILEVVTGVVAKFDGTTARPWLHLLGVFRPKLQDQFRRLGVNSFDSASYFRKAWLRSGQNYLGANGNWYAAVRVPPTSDARTLLRLRQKGYSTERIQKLEKSALSALRSYDKGHLSLDACLDTVKSYDQLLARGESAKDLFAAYRRTLEEKPWRQCDCAVCADIGIDVLIFRGLNRNKRRGAHNTLCLFRSLQR